MNVYAGSFIHPSRVQAARIRNLKPSSSIDCTFAASLPDYQHAVTEEHRDYVLDAIKDKLAEIGERRSESARTMTRNLRRFQLGILNTNYSAQDVVRAEINQGVVGTSVG